MVSQWFSTIIAGQQPAGNDECSRPFELLWNGR